MDPIRPITRRDLDVEPIWRVERAGRDDDRPRDRQQKQSPRREQDEHDEPVEAPVPPPADDDEPPHLIDVIA